MSRTQVTALASLFAVLTANGAQAQDASPPAEEEAATAGEAATPETVAPTPTPAAMPRDPHYARPRPPPPIMVVVLPGARISEDLTAAARAALVSDITELAGGRPVHGLGAAEMVQAFSACADDACIGALLATAGAQAGVILHLDRHGRQVAARLELRDPVSGTARGDAIAGDLPTAAADLAAPLQTLSAQLANAMPAAPGPTPTLLIATTEDNALVTVDGEHVGRSPVGPIEIADGSHEVLVRLEGFSTYHTQAQVRPGERARVDAILNSLTASPDDDAPDFGADGFRESTESASVTDEWWFWAAIGGGAAVLIGLVIGIAVAASSGDQEPVMPDGIPLPPIVGGM